MTLLVGCDKYAMGRWNEINKRQEEVVDLSLSTCMERLHSEAKKHHVQFDSVKCVHGCKEEHLAFKNEHRHLAPHTIFPRTS